jgi:DNA modification methylase
VPDSFAHPAKMDAQLLLWITEHYTKVGETILDPMAGSGTQMLACTLGRNVVLVELEGKFCKMCRDNWELVKMRPQLGYEMGTCQIIQGDARNLEGLLADKIITSPPYEGSDMKSPVVNRNRQVVRKIASHELEYAVSQINIGNLKSTSYLEAMLQVYQQCHRILKPEGLMILVLKNFIRNKKVIRLDLDTIKLCEQAGFELVERHYRKLSSQSFWRVIYHQKYPLVELIDKEDILVFRGYFGEI